MSHRPPRSGRGSDCGPGGRELQFTKHPDGNSTGNDVFGDGSFFAILTPGHTSYLARTTTGPVLLTGDTSHTRWGWENGVEPGTYSYDREQAAASFQKLRAFAAAHPNIEVRVGHQH